MTQMINTATPKTKFSIHLNQTEYGWVDVSLQGVLNQGVWQKAISYLGDHPLIGFIHTAIDLYGHYHKEPLPIKHHDYRAPELLTFTLYSEPEKFTISFLPNETDKLIRFRLTDCNDMMETGNNDSLPRLIAETSVHFDDYFRAVYDAVCVALARQGIIGISDAWGGDRESEKAGYLPVDAMILMAAVITSGSMPEELSFAQEIQLLQQILDHGDIKSYRALQAEKYCNESPPMSE